MEKLGDYVKQSVLNFKLELCCFMTSVRVGSLILACANVALGFITLIALAEETFEPVLLQALNGLAAEPPNFGPTCIIAYAVELGSNTVLLCGLLRNDLVLLRLYLYYSFGVITAAVMVYSVVFFSLEIGLKILILCSVGYQLYLILLIRSVMVEIKQESIKNGYTVNLKQNDIEIPPGAGPREKYSVVIEPGRVKTPITVVMDDKYKPVGTVTVKPKEATLPVHLATKQEVTVKPEPVKEITVKPGPVKEITVKPGPVKEITVKPGPVKEITVKPGPVKEITVPIHGPKESSKADSKEEVIKEKKEATKKPSRSFFGRKEKVKIEDSKAKLDKIDETKKV